MNLRSYSNSLPPVVKTAPGFDFSPFLRDDNFSSSKMVIVNVNDKKYFPPLNDDVNSCCHLYVDKKLPFLKN